MLKPTFNPGPPATNEYAPFYKGYLETLSKGDIFELYRQLDQATRDFITGLPEEKAGYRYAEGKWSIREVVGHITDAERVFAYRALRFSRGDQTPLPGFEEKSYVDGSNFDQTDLSTLSSILQEVRQSNYNLFAGFTAEMFEKSGVASGSNCSVRALLYITVGHGQHHLNILRERYI